VTNIFHVSTLLVNSKLNNNTAGRYWGDLVFTHTDP